MKTFAIVCVLLSIALGYCLKYTALICLFRGEMSPLSHTSSSSPYYVLITGSSTGIGEGLAKLYAMRNATLLLTGRREAELKKVLDKCVQLGANKNSNYLAGDIGLEGEPKRIAEYVKKHFNGVLHVAIVNHALVPTFLLHSMFLKQEMEALYFETMNVNFKASVLLTKFILPYLEAAKSSRLVNIGTMGVYTNTVFLNAYSTAKRAQLFFFDGLRVERELLNMEKGVSIQTIVLDEIASDNYINNIAGNADDDAVEVSTAYRFVSLLRPGPSPIDYATKQMVCRIDLGLMHTFFPMSGYWNTFLMDEKRSLWKFFSQVGFIEGKVKLMEQVKSFLTSQS